MDVKRTVKFRNKTWSKFLCKTFQVLWRAKSGLQGDGDSNILYSEIKAGTVSDISISTTEVSKDEMDSISEELSESDEMDRVSEETIFIGAPVRRSSSCPSQLAFLSTMAEEEEQDSDEDFLPDRTDKHWDWDYTSGDESINEEDIIPSRTDQHWDIGYTSGDESYRDIRGYLPSSDDVNLLDWDSSEDEELFEAITALEDLHEPTPTEEEAEEEGEVEEEPCGGLKQDEDGGRV